MKIAYHLKSLSLVALMSMTALTACSQKPSSEEIAAQVKIALEQEKAAQAAAAPVAPPVVAPTAAPTPVAEPAPVKKEVTHKHHEQHAAATQSQPAAHQQSAQPVEPQVKQVCANCGVVIAVNAVEEQGKGSALGVIGGGVVGGLLGHQVGNGSGRDLATLAGAVGGAFAGNAIEKNAKKTKHFDVVIRMDDGTERIYHQPQDLGFANGDKVRIENDVIIKN